jgi:predicted acylesterase/phospholipase RssA
MNRHAHLAIGLALVLALTACGTFRENARLEGYSPVEGYRFDKLRRGPKNTDDLFVVLTFSGGGTRAAAFSYGVMEVLRDTEIVWDGQTKRLLDEVDIISSVSGGSFTSAYYALHGDGLFDGRFEREFLNKDIQHELLVSALWPTSWFKLAGIGYGRSDLAAEYYDTAIFRGATYAELIKRNSRPFVILNGTDMSAGEPFPFIQDQFDLICSDLSQLPIARAVASSSAFPGLLTPLTYRNFAGTCGYREPEWVPLASRDQRIAPERAKLAERRRGYYARRPWEEPRPFLHVIDGGVSDNIGLRGILFALQGGDSSYSVQKRFNREQIRKLLIIVVNAATDPEANRDSTPRVPCLIDVLTTAATIPLDRYSFDTVERARAIAKEYNDAVRTRKDCENILRRTCPQATLPGGELYAVDIAVSHVSFDMIEDPKTRFEFKNLPTTFKLPPETVKVLRDTAADLLRKDPEFKRFVSQVK